MPDSPSTKRLRAPIAISLAIMLIALALLATAIVLLAEGAVAREARAGRPAPADPNISTQIAPRASEDVSTPREPGAASGRFVLGAAPSSDELELAARIATSSTGGGFVIGGEIHVVIDAERSDPTLP